MLRILATIAIISAFFVGLALYEDIAHDADHSVLGGMMIVIAVVCALLTCVGVLLGG